MRIASLSAAHGTHAHAIHDARNGPAHLIARLVRLARPPHIAVLAAYAHERGRGKRREHLLYDGWIHRRKANDLAFAVEHDGSVRAYDLAGKALEAKVAATAKRTARRHGKVRTGVCDLANRRPHGQADVVQGAKQRTVEVTCEQADHWPHAPETAMSKTNTAKTPSRTRSRSRHVRRGVRTRNHATFVRSQRLSANAKAARNTR